MNLILNSFLGEDEKIDNIIIDNMIGASGREVPNQYKVIINTDVNTYKCFYSYNSLIIIYKNGRLFRIGTDYNYSRTTGKYRNAFTRLTLVELDKIIAEKFTYCSDIEQYVLKEEING